MYTQKLNIENSVFWYEYIIWCMYMCIVHVFWTSDIDFETSARMCVIAVVRKRKHTHTQPIKGIFPKSFDSFQYYQSIWERNVWYISLSPQKNTRKHTSNFSFPILLTLLHTRGFSPLSFCVFYFSFPFSSSSFFGAFSAIWIRCVCASNRL